MVGLRGELAVQAEEALLIWGERLYFIVILKSLCYEEQAGEMTYVDVDLVLLVGVHLEVVFVRAGLLH